MNQLKKRERMLSFLLKLNPEIRIAIINKLRLCVLFIVLWLQGNSQMNVSMSVGTTKDMPLGALQIGYTLKQPYILYWGVEYDQRFFLTREAAYGAYLGGRLSGTYYITNDQTLSALGGGYYSKKSSDYPELNSWMGGYGIKYKYKAAFLELYHLEKKLQVSVGIHCTLN